MRTHTHHALLFVILSFLFLLLQPISTLQLSGRMSTSNSVHPKLCCWECVCKDQGTRSQAQQPTCCLCTWYALVICAGQAMHTTVLSVNVLASCLMSMQAALQEAHDQNERLRLTVSAMRSDMESMHQHTPSPGPPTQPHQSPFPSSSTPFASPHQQTQVQSVMQSQLLSQLQQQSYQQLLQQLPSVGVTGQYEGGTLWSAAQAAPDASVQQRQQEEEVQSLRQRLQDAKCEAQDLAAENERLMELSNALRSERDRAGLTQNSPAFCSQQQQLVAPVNIGNQGSVQQPLVNLTSACMSQSHAHHPVQQGLSGFQHVPQSQMLQAYVVQQPYQAMPPAPHSIMLEQGQGSFDQPQMQSALMQPHESLQYAAQPPTGQSAVPQGQQQPKGPIQLGADDSLPSEVMSICLES